MENPETSEQREELLRDWKQRLGLNDWNIEAKLNCSPSEQQDHFYEGHSQYITSTKRGWVTVLAKKYHEDEDVYDFELTLVHELLHLKFGVLWDNASELAQALLHQMIEEMSIALVDAKRSSQ